MKKSKIIVPALGLLLLSTAASVSGTVAWFTANRTFETNAGNFAVVKTNTDLVCKMTGGIGTKVNNHTTATDYSDDTIELDETATTKVEMTDASFDHDTSNVVVPDADGVKVGKLVSLSSGTLAADLTRATYTTDTGTVTHTVYSALTWEMSFEVSYTAAGSNSALFFDLSKTTFKQSDGTSALTEAGKGFRLAFIPKSGYTNATTRVLARAESTTATWDHDGDGEEETPTAEVNVIRYIDGAAEGDGLNAKAAAYAAANIIGSDTTYAPLPTDNSITAASVANQPAYLGKFVAAANTTVKLEFTVVAWYEGTDPNVVNSSALAEKVKANLAFELRSVLD